MISRLKPFMAYLELTQYVNLKKFSAANKIPMTQLIREAIDARIASGDRFVFGYNKAIDDAIDALNANRASQMRFPSGKSFAEILTEDIIKLKAKEAHEEKGIAKAPDSGRDAGSAEAEDGSDQSLGI
jgi:hypothetical protein